MSSYDWKDILTRLIAYSYALLREDLPIGERSELARDFAVESITRFLEEPSKFDPERNDNLVWYLKYNILRRLINNYHKAAFVINESSYHQSTAYEQMVTNFYSEYIDQGTVIDAKQALNRLNSGLKDKPELFELYNLRYIEGLSKPEICKTLNLSSKDYDNLLKRLKRNIDKYRKLYQE